MRSFIAIDLPDALRRSLADIIDVLSEDIPPQALRWVRPEGIHLTLKFLGDVAQGKMDEVRRVISDVVPRFSAFTYSAGGLGCFPNPRHPRVVWIGVQEPSGELAALQEGLEKELETCGFKREGRKFHPHLTMGRVRREVRQADSRAVGETIVRAEASTLGEFRADEVTLFHSDLKPTGAVYTVLFAAALGERSR